MMDVMRRGLRRGLRTFRRLMRHRAVAPRCDRLAVRYEAVAPVAAGGVLPRPAPSCHFTARPSPVDTPPEPGPADGTGGCAA